MYINGMRTINDVINMIKDTIDEGNLDSAKDYLEELKDELSKNKKEEQGIITAPMMEME
jgi:soluble cytochrome b562